MCKKHLCLLLCSSIDVRRNLPSECNRLAFSSIDRLVIAGIYALAPNILDALKIVKNLLRSYQRYYNEGRTHSAPIPRAVHPRGHIVVTPILGGLHHKYGRV